MIKGIVIIYSSSKDLRIMRDMEFLDRDICKQLIYKKFLKIEFFYGI